MRYLAIIDFDDEALAEAGVLAADGTTDDRDIAASLDARLDEVYCGPDDFPVRGRLVDGAVVTRLLPFLAASMLVGVEGAESDVTDDFGLTPDEVDAAWQIVINLNGGPAGEEAAS